MLGGGRSRERKTPILAPCYLGTDMATRDELIAAHKTVAGVEAVIGAETLWATSATRGW